MRRSRETPVRVRSDSQPPGEDRESPGAVLWQPVGSLGEPAGMQWRRHRFFGVGVGSSRCVKNRHDVVIGPKREDDTIGSSSWDVVSLPELNAGVPVRRKWRDVNVHVRRVIGLRGRGKSGSVSVSGQGGGG